ncbi:MAG: hypothetical protein ABSF61_13520 [Anaerolineales bacterium]|jgi:hypothetical protein
MWTVDLRFGPLRLWRTSEGQIVRFVCGALKRHLAMACLTKNLPGPARAWAATKLSELHRLDEWDRESVDD